MDTGNRWTPWIDRTQIPDTLVCCGSAAAPVDFEYLAGLS